MTNAYYLRNTSLPHGYEFNFHETVNNIENFNNLSRNEMLDFFTTHYSFAHVVEGKIDCGLLYQEINGLIVEMKSCVYCECNSGKEHNGVILKLCALKMFKLGDYDLTKLVGGWVRNKEELVEEVTCGDRWYSLPLDIPQVKLNSASDSEIIEMVKCQTTPSKYSSLWCATAMKPEAKAVAIEALKRVRENELVLKQPERLGKIINSMFVSTSKAFGAMIDTNLSDVLSYDCKFQLRKKEGVLSDEEIEGLVDVLSKMADKIVNLDLGMSSVVPPMYLLEPLVKSLLADHGTYKDAEVVNLGSVCYVTIN